MDRDEVIQKVYETAQASAAGYRQNISQFNTAHENEVAERCACAASNTGYFILSALGLSTDEIKALSK